MIKMEIKTWIINDENGRLDKVATLLDKQISRTSVKRLIDSGKIKVNGTTQKSSYIVKKGDEITIEEEIPQEIELKPQEIPLDVIYEDEDIIVINKPKGLVVHPRKWKS